MAMEMPRKESGIFQDKATRLSNSLLVLIRNCSNYKASFFELNNVVNFRRLTFLTTMCVLDISALTVKSKLHWIC